MTDRNYDFCDDPLNELVAADARVRELLDEVGELESKIPRWISVEERLPEDSQSVLACFEKSGGVGCATFVDLYKCFETDRGCFGATHWMPLPEPPEVK